MDENILHAIEGFLNSKLVNVQNEYLDTQGACFFLGISKSTLYKMNFKKKVPYYKGNGSKKIYYKKSELIAFITQNRLKSKQEIDDEAQRFLIKRKEAKHV